MNGRCDTLRFLCFGRLDSGEEQSRDVDLAPLPPFVEEPPVQEPVGPVLDPVHLLQVEPVLQELVEVLRVPARLVLEKG